MVARTPQVPAPKMYALTPEEEQRKADWGWPRRAPVHYPGDYAHVARCGECQEAERVATTELPDEVNQA